MRKGLSIMIILIILCTSLLNIISTNSSSYPIGWSEDTRLTFNTNNSVTSVIRVWENFIHIFWLEQIPGPGSEYDIFYRRSIDGGRTWEATRKLIDTDKVLSGLSVALNNSTIHLVWSDNRSGFNYIYYTKSNNSGESWENEKIISDPSSGGYDPDIAVNNNYVHVVYWHDFKIFYMNSTDDGNSWSEVQQLTGSIRDSKHPSIAVNGTNIHIVWLDHYDKHGQATAGAIFYMNSTDGGLTWAEDINITEMNLDAAYPYIIVNGSMVHVVYSKEVAGLWQGYYRRSEDNGINWTVDIKIMDPSNDLFIDDIAFENNRLYVVGSYRYVPNIEIHFVKSIDNGQNWEDDIQITNFSENSLKANIDVYKNKIYVSWEDYRDGNPEIYYKYYPFYPPPTNLTIDIWRTNLTLNWTTPQIGLSPVDYYLIYRTTDPEAFTFTDSEIIYNSSGTGNDLLATWNDTTAFLDENNNYYYVVRAVYENGEIDINENIVGKFMIALNSGWNLISLPLAQNDTIISEALKSIDGNYNIIQWYNAKEGIWRSSLSDLTDINRTMGLWIHMKNACNLSVFGAVLESTDIALYEGWNLVGYPSLKTRNLGDALNGITWQAVQHYNAFDHNDPWKHNSTKKPDNLNDLKEMQPGRGYWVYVTINDTWIRTRTVEDYNVVIWRVHGQDEKVVSQYNYKPIIEKLPKIGNDNEIQTDVIPEEPMSKNEYDQIEISPVLLIFFIIILFICIKLHNKRQSPPKKSVPRKKGDGFTAGTQPVLGRR